MRLNNHKARQLLKKYLQGNCTPREIELLHEWYDTIQASDTDASVHTGKGKDEIAERLLQAIHHKIDKPSPEVPVRRLPFNARIVAAAAFIGGLLILGVFLAVRKNSRSPPAAKMLALQEARNEGKAAKRITLPDGTQVWLNTRSKLTWTDAFGRQQRSVQLEGEGYFEVANDPVHPFLVTTPAITTRVLGTAFNIEAYKEEGNVRVALVKGSVLLSAKDVAVSATKLAPGQIASIRQGMSAFQVKQGDATALASWTSGGFVLQDLPLEDALQRLCRKYGYTIQGDPGERRRKPVTASFGKESFQEILTDILYVNHLTFSIKDSIVIIHK